MDRSEVIRLVLEERDRQDAKWGKQDHHDFVWNAILGEEKGEVEKALLEHYHGDDFRERIKEEIIQVAAVAIAWLEYGFPK